MHGHFGGRDTTTPWLRWSGRLIGVLAGGFFGMFALAEGVPALGSGVSRENSGLTPGRGRTGGAS